MLYVFIIFFHLIIGLYEENAFMCMAAGLFAVAAEIQAKKDGDGNG